MEVLQSVSVLVKCPHCGNKFNPEDAINHDLRLRLEEEYERKLLHQSQAIEERVRQQANEKYQLRLKMLEEDRQAKVSRLQELEKLALTFEQRERQIREKEETLEVEMKKKMLALEQRIREDVEKKAFQKAELALQERERKLVQERERLEMQMMRRIHEETERVRVEERLKMAELQKKLDDQNKLINEMKRKSEQGSMQLQGEVQELAIEEYLENTFPRDEIESIAKGKRGADCVHMVKDPYGNICGRILYESKRTKTFSGEWIGKIKDDMRLKQADIGVIVTEAFPEGMTRFGEKDGIWICSFVEFKALALLLRQNLLRIGEILAAEENKGDKMQLIYSYVTGAEFRQKLEAAFESFREMQEDLIREKAALTSQWAKREKRLLKAMENLASLYGDVRGIAGGAVQEIRSLETVEPELLM